MIYVEKRDLLVALKFSMLIGFVKSKLKSITIQCWLIPLC